VEKVISKFNGFFVSKRNCTRTGKLTSKGITLVEIASSIFFISIIGFLISEFYHAKLLSVNNSNRNVESVMTFLRQEVKLADRLWVDRDGNLQVQNQQSKFRYRWLAIANCHFLIREIWDGDKWLKRPNILLPAFSIRPVDGRNANVSFVQVAEKGVGVQIQEGNYIWVIDKGD